MKIKEKEFALSLEEGMIDFSSKKNKNGRKIDSANGGKKQQNRPKNNELIIDPQNLYIEPLEQFDEEFSEDLKVSTVECKIRTSEYRTMPKSELLIVRTSLVRISDVRAQAFSFERV